jgi:hypothetical protein
MTDGNLSAVRFFLSRFFRFCRIIFRKENLRVRALPENIFSAAV